MRQVIHGLPFLSTKKNMPVFLVVVVLLVKRMSGVKVPLVLDRKVFILWVNF